jgi:Ca2+-binding EF-hand superfamily protein
MTRETADPAYLSNKPDKSGLVTLEVLINLLELQGLSDTAACLQREAGFRHASSDGSHNPDMVASAAEEDLRIRTEAAASAQAEHRGHLASVSQDLSKQGQQLSGIRDLVSRVRNVANAVSRPSLEEQEEKIKNNAREINELEMICTERDALGRELRIELDSNATTMGDLRRSLEEHEDEETKSRIRLTRLEEEVLKLTAELEAPPVATQARKIQNLLAHWYDQDHHLQKMIRQLFLENDRDRDGRLEWNNNEIRNFVHELFHRNSILLPNWQEHVWYEMYRKADVNASYSLELEEAMRFARNCFEAALALVLTGQSENSTSATVLGDFWNKTHMGEPMPRQAMTYSSGVVIDFIEHATVFGTVIAANNAHHVRMVRIIETGEHLKSTMKTYRECDKDGNGRLTWNNGEIRDFITACFKQHGLFPPNEEQIYAMYVKFDKDKNNALDMRECLEMVDALFRSTFIVHDGNSSVKTATQSNSVVQSNSAVKFVQPVSTASNVRVVGQSPMRQAVSPNAGRVLAGQVQSVTIESAPGSTVIRAASPIIRPGSPHTAFRSTQQDLFDQIDTNHDGVISRAELDNALHRTASAPVESGSIRTIANTVVRASSPKGTVQFGVVPALTIVPSGRPSSPGIVREIVTQVSPRVRGVSPDRTQVVIRPVPAAWQMGGGGSVEAEPGGLPRRSGYNSPGTSNSGSHVANALSTGSLPRVSLKRSSSNEQLGNVIYPGAQVQQVGPRTLTDLRPVVRTRPGILS